MSAILTETPTSEQPETERGPLTRDELLKLAAQEDASSDMFPEQQMAASVNPDAGDHAPAESEQEAETGNQDDGTPEAEMQGDGTRQQKSAKRATKTWEEVNALKDEVKAMQADLLAMRNGDTPLAKIATYKQEAEKQLARAKELKADGDEDGYKAALDAAELATARAEGLKRRREAEVMKSDLLKQSETIKAEYPDIAKPESDMAKRHAGVIKDFPVLTTIKDGPKISAILADSLASKERLAAVEKELAATKKLLQPGSGNAPAISRNPGGEPKTQAEKRKQIIAELREHDRANGFIPAL